MLILKRTYEKNFTKGEINIPNMFRLDVLELTYNNNQKDISCIPENKYIIKCHNSPKFGKCLKVFEKKQNTLKEVNGRSDILIHSGNAVKDFSFLNSFNQTTSYNCDSKGCILVGMGFFEVQDKDGEKQAYITGSKTGLSFLFDCVKKQGGAIELLITSKESNE